MALCLPEAASATGRRAVITELGPDAEAVRARDRDALLFDLGLGAPHIDACVRTRDPEAIAFPRAVAGSALLDPATGAATALASLRPHRVFASRAGRVEVFTPIPPPDGTSSKGPRTHLLPALLASGRAQPPPPPIRSRRGGCRPPARSPRTRRSTPSEGLARSRECEPTIPVLGEGTVRHDDRRPDGPDGHPVVLRLRQAT
ncbi:MAG TPA: hypothetical protein VIL16_04355 [Trebonia sp.]